MTWDKPRYGVYRINRLAGNIYFLLNVGGYLLFSQEHPFVIATFGGHQHYNKDESGNYTSFTFSNYGQPGKRDTFWYVDGVEKYHRRFSGQKYSIIIDGKEGTANISSRLNCTLFVSLDDYYLQFNVK